MISLLWSPYFLIVLFFSFVIFFGVFLPRSVAEGLTLCQSKVGPSAVGCSTISVNPLSWKQLCLFGPERILLWNVECCDRQTMLVSKYVAILKLQFLTASNFAHIQGLDWCD